MVGSANVSPVLLNGSIGKFVEVLKEGVAISRSAHAQSKCAVPGCIIFSECLHSQELLGEAEIGCVGGAEVGASCNAHEVLDVSANCLGGAISVSKRVESLCTW